MQHSHIIFQTVHFAYNGMKHHLIIIRMEIYLVLVVNVHKHVVNGMWEIYKLKLNSTNIVYK